MKLKAFLSELLFAGILILSISFSSCKKDDNPVNPYNPPPPPVHLDTADRYIWSVCKVPAQLMGIYAADTNKVYAIGDFYLIESDGITYHINHLNDPSFWASDVYGYDKNNIFVAGFFLDNGAKHPALKKIENGNTIKTYRFGIDNDFFGDMLIVGPNQLWITDSYCSKIYYFDNGNYKTYTLSKTDTLIYEYFYKDNNSDLFLFCVKTENQVTGTYYTYKFINDGFVLQGTDCFGYDPCLSPRLFRCGSDILMGSLNSQKIRLFNGINWTIFSDTSQGEWPSRMGGISKDSLIMASGSGDIITYGYRGWVKEKYTPDIGYTTNEYFYNAEMKFGNVYISYEARTTSSILIGRANKNTK